MISVLSGRNNIDGTYNDNLCKWYQIVPREAVPEVSKGKGYINQEKRCL